MDTNVGVKERMRALELLGKEQAMWIDRTDNDGNMDIQINLNGLSDE